MGFFFTNKRTKDTSDYNFVPFLFQGVNGHCPISLIKQMFTMVIYDNSNSQSQFKNYSQLSSYKRYTYLGFLFCISIYILSLFIPFNNKKCKYHLAVFDNYTIRSHCPRQLSWTPKARAVKFICMYLVKGFMDITIKLISHYFKKVF